MPGRTLPVALRTYSPDVCLVRSTAAGRGDPGQRSPTQYGPLRAIVRCGTRWHVRMRSDASNGRRTLTYRVVASESVRFARGQRLGSVCLHLLNTCTFSLSLYVPQVSSARYPPSSPRRLEDPHVPRRPHCTAKEFSSNAVRPERPPPTHPTRHRFVAARLNLAHRSPGPGNNPQPLHDQRRPPPENRRRSALKSMRNVQAAHSGSRPK